MRRVAVPIVLAAVPLALIGWVLWAGRNLPVEPALIPTTVPPTTAPAAPGPASTPPAATPPDDDQSLKALFATPLAGAAATAVTLYDEKQLFDYIDGAAPAYLERHFRRLVAAELATGGGELTADVYDMRGRENARSIFDAERSERARPVAGWPEARAGSMAFAFHADRYYVKLTAFDAKAEAALPAVGQALRERLP